jgi:hypothetical protein
MEIVTCRRGETLVVVGIVTMVGESEPQKRSSCAEASREF